MNEHEQKRFDQLYQRHVRALKLHGYAASTIDVYARAVRRLVAYFDCLPDQIDREPLETHSEGHDHRQTRSTPAGVQLPPMPITDAHPGLYPAGLAIRVDRRNRS